MKEQNIRPMEACSKKVEYTPEQQIVVLRNQLKDERIEREELRNKLDFKESQVIALTDVLCDLREMNKRQANDLSWHCRRAGDYRDIHHEAWLECNDIISDYENDDPYTVRPGKAVYNFAKKIRDILRKI